MHEANITIALNYRQAPSAEGNAAACLLSKQTREAKQLPAATYGNVGVEPRDGEGAPLSTYKHTCPQRLAVAPQEANDMVNEFQRHAISQDG